MARIAMMREETMRARRREAALALPSGISTVRSGGISDPMRKVDEMIDAEARSGDLTWAEATVRGFDAAMARLRRECIGEIFDGTYAAECRFRLCMSRREAASVLGISERTLSRQIAVLCDYLDYIGKNAIGL